VRPRNYHHGDLPSALLDAAEGLIRERALDGWSVREVSVQVGVSSSAVYHHFESRDALVRALSDRVIARVGARLASAVASATGGPQQGLIEFGRGYIRWALDDPAVARLVFAAGRIEPRFAIAPHPHDVLVAELNRLVDAGFLTEASRAGADFVVWAAVHGLATLLLDGLIQFDSDHDMDREVERLVLAVLNGLAHETAPDPAWPTARSAHTKRSKGATAER